MQNDRSRRMRRKPADYDGGDVIRVGQSSGSQVSVRVQGWSTFSRAPGLQGARDEGWFEAGSRQVRTSLD